jgi:hypothetical protein
VQQYVGEGSLHAISAAAESASWTSSFAPARFAPLFYEEVPDSLLIHKKPMQAHDVTYSCVVSMAVEKIRGQSSKEA